MKKSSIEKISFRTFLFVASFAQLLLFTECKKEEEVTPIGSTDTGTVTDEVSAPVNDSIPQTDSTGSVEEPTTGTDISDPVTDTPPTDVPPTGNTSGGNTGSSSGSTNTTVAYTITSSQSVVDGSKLNLAPGAVVKIEGGTRGALLLRNFSGNSGAPITFINGSGTTVIKSSGSYGLKMENCKFFRLTGTGGGSSKGLVVDGGHIGMSLDKLSTEFEIDHVEVMNCGFAGIMAKTDPSCDQNTWRGNFVMRNLKFHDNYVHDVKGEGFYVGNSFFASGRSLSCGNILPHEIVNAAIYNNKIVRSGCEGIQAGCVISGLKIYNNIVENFGVSPFASAQNNGVQIGEGSSGVMYNNVIKNGPGNGIIVLGSGKTRIYNNLVVNPGSYGAFIDNRGPASGEIAFVNNTFISPRDGGLKTYNELVSNKFCNNIITGTSRFFSYGSGASGQELNNLVEPDVSKCMFVDPSSGNFKLKSGSPAIDKGMNAAGFGVVTDMVNKGRPSGSGYDIGAFEF